MACIPRALDLFSFVSSPLKKFGQQSLAARVGDVKVTYHLKYSPSNISLPVSDDLVTPFHPGRGWIE